MPNLSKHFVMNSCDQNNHWEISLKKYSTHIYLPTKKTGDWGSYGAGEDGSLFSETFT